MSYQRSSELNPNKIFQHIIPNRALFYFFELIGCQTAVNGEIQSIDER